MSDTKSYTTEEVAALLKITMNDTKSYTAEEVAALLRITKFTVYEMIKRGDLTEYRIGRKIRIKASDLDDYIQKSKDHCGKATACKVR